MSDQLFQDAAHTVDYRLYRPGYPKQLYEYITGYYFDGQETREKIPLALDVACGSGQATVELSSFCDRVIGVDVSANQIAQAIAKPNIEYRCNTAEELTFLQSNTVDLVTVATALHWFDRPVFFREVQRVLKVNTGVFAVWTYGLGHLDHPAADAAYQEVHQDILLDSWHEKGGSALGCYESEVSTFPFQSTLRVHAIERSMETTIGQFLGFIQTFSASQTYRKQKGEEAYQSLLRTFRGKLIEIYRPSGNGAGDSTGSDDDIQMTFSFPLRLYLMRNVE